VVEVDCDSGDVTHQWPIAGGPDATFFNPATGLVHVAIGEPGLVQSLDPRTGSLTQIATARERIRQLSRSQTGSTSSRRQRAVRWFSRTTKTGDYCRAPVRARCSTAVILRDLDRR